MGSSNPNPNADDQPHGEPQSNSGWVPTKSTVGGAGIGLVVAQFCIALYNQLKPQAPVSAELASAFTALLSGVAGYIFKDGGRR